jgi:hypothetical protein
MRRWHDIVIVDAVDIFRDFGSGLCEVLRRGLRDATLHSPLLLLLRFDAPVIRYTGLKN